jgi:hypothetical protein
VELLLSTRLGSEIEVNFRACMVGLGDICDEPAHWIMPVISSGKSTRQAGTTGFREAKAVW